MGRFGSVRFGCPNRGFQGQTEPTGRSPAIFYSSCLHVGATSGRIGRMLENVLKRQREHKSRGLRTRGNLLNENFGAKTSKSKEGPLFFSSPRITLSPQFLIKS